MNAKGITNVAKSIGATLKTHSPEIFVGAGIAGTVVGTVLACKATTKLDGILEKTKMDVAKIKTFDPSTVDVEYTEKDRQKDLVIEYTKGGVALIKLYGPAFAVLSVSIASILVGTNILKHRNFALMSAYTSLDQAFRGYRNRVKDRYGEAVEEELRMGLEKRKITEEVVDENGKTKKTKKDILATKDKPEGLIEFSDATSSYWDNVMDYNINFTTSRQALLNDMLIAKGFLLMSEVKELFDLPVDSTDYMVGWTYRPNNNEGDNIVNLRWKDALKEVVDDNGEILYEPVIYMDPNYDGIIVGTKSFDDICKRNKLLHR